jgi:hypothetical protein
MDASEDDHNDLTAAAAAAFAAAFGFAAELRDIPLAQRGAQALHLPAPGRACAKRYTKTLEEGTRCAFKEG